MTFTQKIILMSWTLLLTTRLLAYGEETQIRIRSLNEDEKAILSQSDQIRVRPDFYQETFRDGQLKVYAGGDIRYRFELRNNFNLNDRTFEDDAFHLVRTRLHTEIRSSYGNLFVEAQDSLSLADSERHKSAGFVNRLDLHQLYAELQSPWAEIPLEVKVGRQKLKYGDERLVGAFEWGNTARVFDAVKTVWKPVHWFQGDFFFSRPVSVNTRQADWPNPKENFYGLYTSAGPYRDHLLDSFLFIRHNRRGDLAGETPGDFGDLEEFTAGNRLKGKWQNFDYGIEWAWQFGERANSDIHAWAWHSGIGYTFKDVWSKPRLGFEYNHGSGDSDPTDGTIQTFDNLFPTNHIFYGDMDFASLRNMHHFALDLKFKPHRRVSIKIAQHWFRLDTPSGAWFNAAGGVLRAASPGASYTLGSETDLTAKIELHSRVNLLIGYAHFAAGPFVGDSGAHDNADFLYAMTGLSF